MTGSFDVLRELHATGVRYGRPPEPVPEADPWEEPDPYDHHRSVMVVFPGYPRVRVTVHDDGEDAVELDSGVAFDVPRRHTAAVVEAILSGRGCYIRETTGWREWLAPLLFSDELIVELPDATYSQYVPWRPDELSAWVTGLPRRRPQERR